MGDVPALHAGDHLDVVEYARDRADSVAIAAPSRRAPVTSTRRRRGSRPASIGSTRPRRRHRDGSRASQGVVVASSDSQATGARPLDHQRLHLAVPGGARRWARPPACIVPGRLGRCGAQGQRPRWCLDLRRRDRSNRTCCTLRLHAGRAKPRGGSQAAAPRPRARRRPRRPGKLTAYVRPTAEEVQPVAPGDLERRAGLQLVGLRWFACWVSSSAVGQAARVDASGPMVMSRSSTS